MAPSIETLGTMAANCRGGLGHSGSAALADWTTNRLIRAVRLMVSALAKLSITSMVSAGSSNCTRRREARVFTSVISHFSVSP
jgi:hypothetical protein